jgi:hypothetical protein
MPGVGEGWAFQQLFQNLLDVLLLYAGLWLIGFENKRV